jgi:hypothetical protein
MTKFGNLCLAVLVLAPSALFAQTTLPKNTPLSTVVYELYRIEIEDNIRVLRASGLLTPQAEESARGDLPEALVISQAISNQLSTFPLGSSAGGFSWTFDPALGMFTRGTTSFGPLFAERALTIGKNKLNFGLNYERATYDELEGRSLRDREIGFFTAFLPNQIGDDSLSLDLSMDTVGFFANYGVTNRLDVGVALPLVSVNLDASLQFVFRDRTGQILTTPGLPLVRTGGRRKTGFGDIIARAKYNFLPTKGGGLAAGLDVRLPTGDEENLLGIPGTQAKVYGVVSTAFGNVSPHVNIGYTFSRGNEAAKDPDSVLLAPPDEINYTAGADVAITRRLTVAGDFVGRTLKDVPKLSFGDVGLGASFQEFSFVGFDNLHLTLASIGAKFNARGNLLISANILFPLTDRGLRDKLTPVVGIDYSF